MVDHERMYDDMRRAPFVWLAREIAGPIWPKLSDKAARVYISLCALQDGSHSARGCWPGLAYLAQQNACSQDAVRRAIAELVDLKLIVVEQRFTASGAQQSNRYVLVDPDTPLAPVQPPPRVGATPPLAPVQGDQYIYDQELNNYSSHSALRLNVSAQNVAPAQPSSVSISEQKSQVQPNFDLEADDLPAEDAPVAAPKASKRRSKPTKDTNTHDERKSPVQDVLNAFMQESGQDKSTIGWAREGSAAKKLVAAGYSTEQIIACYRYYKAQDFWSDKFLSLTYIAKNISEFLKSQNRPKGGQHVVDQKNGILANGWQNLRESDQEKQYQSENRVLTNESVEDILNEALAILTGKDR